MSAPYYTGQGSASGSPYRPGTADVSWDHSRPSTVGETRQDMYAQMPADGSTSSQQLRPEPLQPTQQHAEVVGGQMGAYLGQNVVTPRQSVFPRGQIEGSSHFGVQGAMDSYDHAAQGVMPADTPRAAHFGGGGFDTSKMNMAGAHTFAPATNSAWPSTFQQHSADATAYSRYTYPTQTGSSSWSTSAGMSMSHNIIYDTCSSSANTSPNRSQTYYDMSGDQFDHSNYGSHMGSHTYPMYGDSTSKMGSSGAYISASQPEYPPEEIDSMLDQVSTLYKTANTKKMAEFYRDKWARMWLTCNYTLKPSIQISIPRTILHESYRRACDSFGLEPLQAASFGKVLRSQFPDVAQRRLGGRGKTRFHYCGFGTSNEREAIKVKSLLEDEKAGKLQLSAGLSAEYASEARAKARCEGQHGESSSYRNNHSSEGSPVEAQSSRSTQFDNSPHASSESSTLGNNPGVATDDRLIASAFATLNSAVMTPPGTSSGTTYGTQDGSAARYSQVQSQGLPHVAHLSSSASGSGMPRRHTVSHSYSGLSEMSYLPGGGVHPSSETGDGSMMHSGDVSAFGPGSVSGISEPAQSGSLLNSPASSLHGYHYVQDLRHVSSSIPLRRPCQEFPDWPNVPGHTSSSTASNPAYASTTSGTSSSATNHATGTHPSAQEMRKAWPNNFVLE
ncbi:related to RFX1-major transcriptional repressor of DNA-damage-regulated genes [Ustilago bromivora]|uniref:Related to RFX1-major transcriptional repressor of DNA-damage-regulated genes n=1 Tax=Ustilago bromivora TaxID=307758 RepID=A0A1K0G2H3_9BASI|nr:related to RFX1-major transcriptional repressor of DNA-damage-regulated genes [Ustilago bromivora]